MWLDRGVLRVDIAHLQEGKQIGFYPVQFIEADGHSPGDIIISWRFVRILMNRTSSCRSTQIV